MPKKPHVEPLTNLAAAQSGSTRVALETLRDTLAEQLDAATSNVHAQLAAQYRATIADIAALDAPAETKGAVDELKARRSRAGAMLLPAKNLSDFFVFSHYN